VLPAYPKGQPKVTVLKFVIPPKTRLPDHYHTVINSGYVIKGELTVVDVNNEVLYLKEGDVIVELVNKIHHGVNNGDVPVELVVFYAGTTDLPITVLADPNAKGH
jgi:quercetin dioxygenase-like cupin family protein